MSRDPEQQGVPNRFCWTQSSLRTILFHRLDLDRRNALERVAFLLARICHVSEGSRAEARDQRRFEKQAGGVKSRREDQRKGEWEESIRCLQ